MHPVAHRVQAEAPPPLLSPLGQACAWIWDQGFFSSSFAGSWQIGIHRGVKHIHWLFLVQQSFPFQTVGNLSERTYSIWLSSHTTVLDRRLYFLETIFLIFFPHLFAHSFLTPDNPSPPLPPPPTACRFISKTIQAKVFGAHIWTCCGSQNVWEIPRG